MSHQIRRARASDLDAAARLLAAAFDSYPWTRWALPEDGYADRLVKIQLLYLSHALDHGIVLVDAQLSAVAAFLPADTPQPSDQMQQRVAELHGDRLSMLAELSLPPAPAGAWTLETVGVDPARQGTGLGTAVTTAGLGMMDGRAATVALETSDERNVRLYRRLGFAVAATTAIPGGPTVVSMTRTPRADGADFRHRVR
ncbi:GCN5 family acetyltransferase [Leifsonia sp. Root4]|uniref:GNAT family N-acetyltransferase n=1 Tax=Leifsonia sp. Root4 TaxID=1736525 RepID=UPI0006FD4C39|nr:GNAT family N-acetyltransferase [Leifsonia sp. Root4]KQW06613.1 GCN5 family acetyltransferase [Leifsonia sp. Root4]